MELYHWAKQNHFTTAAGARNRQNWVNLSQQSWQRPVLWEWQKSPGVLEFDIFDSSGLNFQSPAPTENATWVREPYGYWHTHRYWHFFFFFLTPTGNLSQEIYVKNDTCACERQLLDPQVSPATSVSLIPFGMRSPFTFIHICSTFTAGLNFSCLFFFFS